jgi:cytochrome c-type biogenesis protein CcmH
VGLAKSQNGNAAGAIDIWIAALKAAAPDSLWGPRLRAQIEQQARAAKIDVSSQLPPPQAAPATAFAGPTAQDVQQTQAMSPQEQQAMINNMVEGLDQRLRQNPADPDGWVRLIRSRKVMGCPDLARDALSRAMVAFAGDPTTKQKIAAAAGGLGITMDR